MARPHPRPPESPVTILPRRVAFHETDAMGIVHHANYAKYFEEARVVWMDEHHVPYADYLARDLHFAVTRLDVAFRQAARFNDALRVVVWLERVGGASVTIGYELRRQDDVVATGLTEHALVDGTGRVVRIPKELREGLASAVRVN